MDTYLLDVEYVGREEEYSSPPRHTSVEVLAVSPTDAELMALEMVSADGRKPIRVMIDWDNF